eukprot:gene14479-17082_t
MKSYFYDTPSELVSVEDLKALNVLYYFLDVNNYQEPLKQLCEERGYKNTDQVKLNKDTPSLEDKLKIFFEEFALDENRNVHAMRLFTDAPKRCHDNSITTGKPLELLINICLEHILLIPYRI